MSGAATSAVAVERALAENNALIAAALRHHSAGRHAACASLLCRIQRNLVYVASIADIAAPASSVPMGMTTPAAPSTTIAAQDDTDQQIRPTNGDGQGIAPAQAANTPHNPENEGKDRRPKRLIAPAKHWTDDERKLFEEALELYRTSGKKGRPDIYAIAQHVGTRTPVQVRSFLQKHLLRVAKAARAAAASTAGCEDACEAGGAVGGGVANEAADHAANSACAAKTSRNEEGAGGDGDGTL